MLKVQSWYPSVALSTHVGTTHVGGITARQVGLLGWIRRALGCSIRTWEEPFRSDYPRHSSVIVGVCLRWECRSFNIQARRPDRQQRLAQDLPTHQGSQCERQHILHHVHASCDARINTLFCNASSCIVSLLSFPTKQPLIYGFTWLSPQPGG